MKIIGNKFFINNTFRFIFPIMRMHGNDYIHNMASLYKQGVFIDDIDHPNISNIDSIHVLVNTEKSVSISNNIRFFDSQEYMRKRYIYSVENSTKVPSRIVLVLDLPRKYNDTIEKFVNGSRNMFSADDVNKYFKETIPENAPFFRYCRNVLLNRKVFPTVRIEEEVLGM